MKAGVMSHDHVVFIVDDDEGVRDELGDLLESHALHARAFGSAGEYALAPKPDRPACLVLDVELPDINGLDLPGRRTPFGWKRSARASDDFDRRSR